MKYNILKKHDMETPENEAKLEAAIQEKWKTNNHLDPEHIEHICFLEVFEKGFRGGGV